jgi:hypothetical protein
MFFDSRQRMVAYKPRFVRQVKEVSTLNNGSEATAWE